MLLSVDQKSSMLHHFDMSQNKELAAQRDSITQILDEYIAVIDECTMTRDQLSRKILQNKTAFLPRRLEKMCGSPKPTLAYVQGRHSETLSWLQNEIQHCHMNVDMSKVRIQRIGVQLARIKSEDSKRDLTPLDFQRLKISVRKVEAEIKNINSQYAEMKTNERRVEHEHAHFFKVMETAEATLAQIKNDIQTRSSMLQHIMKEKKTLRNTIEKEKERKLASEEKLARFVVPPVMDYVKDVQHVRDAEKELKSIRRSVDVAELRLRQVRSVWKEITEQQALVVSNDDAIDYA